MLGHIVCVQLVEGEEDLLLSYVVYYAEFDKGEGAEYDEYDEEPYAVWSYGPSGAELDDSYASLEEARAGMSAQARRWGGRLLPARECDSPVLHVSFELEGLVEELWDQR